MTTPIDPTVHDRLSRAAQWLLDRFAGDDNITGTAVGYRLRGGQVTDEAVVTVMVKKKRRSSLISHRRLIPRHIDIDGMRCGTDVLQAQAVAFAADGTTPLNPDKYRPLYFGCGISNLSDPAPDAGTMGCFVRDNTDSTIGFVTANHVIADNNTAPAGDPILQPALLDDPTGTVLTNGIGELKRYVPIVGGATTVDVALGEIDSSVSVNGSYAGAGVAAPSVNRPAVGMVVAGDGFGNVWLTRMSSTLTAIDATLLPVPAAGANTNVMPGQPAFGTRLRKSGRTTGVTSNLVLGTGQSVNVAVPGQGSVTYSDLIWVQWLAWNGDSGSVATKKADPGAPPDPEDEDSRELIAGLIKEKFDPCEVLDAIQYAYDIPITGDEALSDDIRDEFMSQSATGRFLITLCYLNSQLVRDRLEDPQDPTDQAFAQTCYDEYQPIIADVMTNPASTYTLSQYDGDMYSALLDMLYNSGVIVYTEWNAMQGLKATHETAMNGMGRAAVQAYMDDYTVLQSVLSTVQSMPAVELTGPATALGGFEQ